MKPGVKTIIAGGATLLLGIIVVPLVFILPLLHGKQGNAQFKSPGSGVFAIKEPGRYYLWNDFRTVYDGKVYDKSETIPDGYEFRFRDADNLQLEFLSDSSISSSFNSSAKKSVGYVEVPHPGKVTVEVSGGNEERIFSFSQSRLLKMLGLILGGSALFMLFCLGGIGLIVWGISKLARSNRKNEI
jgi:hypothetical protein